MRLSTSCMHGGMSGISVSHTAPRQASPATAIDSSLTHARLPQVLVEKLGNGADAAAEAIVAAAAGRGGEISRAGRESSLSADADALLSAAVRCLSASKASADILMLTLRASKFSHML